VCVSFLWVWVCVLAICVRVLSIERLDDHNPNRPKKGRINRRRNNFDLALLCLAAAAGEIKLNFCVLSVWT